jgi:hypothetical protein
MLYYVDTEFTNLGKDAELISIGVISEKGDSFYAILSDYNKEKCSDFVKENILPKLGKPGISERIVSSKKFILKSYNTVDSTKKNVRERLLKFLSRISDYTTFVSDVCHYDGVLIFDLLMDERTKELPKNINPMVIDISTVLFYQRFRVEKELEKNGEKEKSTDTSEIEKYAFDKTREDLVENLEIFGTKTENNEDYKHNALWDAFVISLISKKFISNTVNLAFEQVLYGDIMELIKERMN